VDVGLKPNHLKSCVSLALLYFRITFSNTKHSNQATVLNIRAYELAIMVKAAHKQ
jgi:hypothetical protein